MYKGMTLTEMVKNKSVTFQFYRKGDLWYCTEDRWNIPIFL